MKMPTTFNWNEEDAIYVSAETINAKIDEMKELEKLGKIKEIPFYTAKNRLRIMHTYCINKNSYSVVLRIFNNSDDYQQYMFNTNRGTSVKEEPEISGMEAYNYIEEMFQKEYGKSKSLFTAFSGMLYKEQYNAIKNCVPKPVSMINRYIVGKPVNHVRKADISSAYPAEGSKLLPTLHGFKQVPGRVKPSPEYPFAFYINSHHMAVYNEFDTMSWCWKRRHYTLYDQMYDDSIPEEEDITILCKASEYSLKDIFEDIYIAKLNGDSRAKLGMNAAIGMFQKNNNPRLSMISAVIIARCVNRILKLAEKLENNKSTVLLIATDSIIWVGSTLEEATNKKFLGSFTYEIHDGKFYGISSKAYQTVDDEGVTKTKYSGMKNTEEKKNLKFGELPTKSITKRYMISDDGHVTEVNWAI